MSAPDETTTSDGFHDLRRAPDAGDGGITAQDFNDIVTRMGQIAIDDIAWAEAIRAPTDPDDFALECIFVICNSGMKNTVAQRIFNRVKGSLAAGNSASTAFGHKGKCLAIEKIWRNRVGLLAGFQAAEDKLAYLVSLPWIGDITKYHLAKNFGLDVAKPDVHLRRLADREGTTPQGLCERLAAITGYRAATVDTVLWRACANGVVNSRTGAIKADNDA